MYVRIPQTHTYTSLGFERFDAFEAANTGGPLAERIELADGRGETYRGCSRTTRGPNARSSRRCR